MYEFSYFRFSFFHFQNFSKMSITSLRTKIIFSFFVFVQNASAQKSIITQHGDNGRSGWYKYETVLNQKNVRPGSFGKLFTRPVDDQMYAQPLVVCNIEMPGVGKRNIVIAATVNNTVYAFDADSANRTEPYWQRNLTEANARVVKKSDMSGACFGFYRDFTGNMGIVGTPAIDTNNHIMYVVARSFDTVLKKYSQYLHKMDIRTGNEMPGSPVYITATIPGYGDGSVDGLLTFQQQKQNQRPGLLLLGDEVYIAWASHCDWGPYHGWVMGFDKNNLQLKHVYNTTPDGYNGGIWMTGGGPAADAEGNVYVGSGNGSVGISGDPGNIRNRSESVLKLAPSGDTMKVMSFFTPQNFQALENADLDLGVSQVMLVPETNLAMVCVKDGSIYLMDKDNLGGYSSSGNNVVQTISLGSNASLRSALTWYGGSEKGYAYSWSGNSILNEYPFLYSDKKFDLPNTISSGVQGPSGSVGAFMSVSSNGSLDSTAILWAAYPATGDANGSVRPGILRAFDATNVNNELWNSSIFAEDKPASFAKFNCATICNGKVYLPTFTNALEVYGLTGNKTDTCSTENLALNKTATASSDSGTVYEPHSAVDGNFDTRWISTITDPQYLYVDLGTVTSLCRVVTHWVSNNTRDFKIQVSDDAVSWMDVAAVTDNIITDNYIQVSAAGRYVRVYATKRANKNLGYSLTEFEVYGQKEIAGCTPPDDLYADSITQTGATLHWKEMSVVKKSFKVEYKTVSAAFWNVEFTTNDSLILNNISCGTSYLFRVRAECDVNDTSEYSNSAAFTTLACDGGCNPLPTRWYTEDIGNTALPGKACYNEGVFEISGSGEDIGGHADGFRFAYKTLVGDGEITARVVDLDLDDPLHKAGIMIRETLSPGSRFAFIGLSVGSAAVFETRSETEGTANTQSSSSIIEAPYWIRLIVSGSTYAAYISPDGNEWIQVGAAVDAGFGNGLPVYSGLAVTSHNNDVLSTAHIDNYLLSGVLPLQLIDFRASLNLNHSVLVEWIATLDNTTKYFALERSSDNNHYTEIDRQYALTTGEYTVNYQTIDAHPTGGINYYRLRMVDADGQFSYSQVASIRVTNAKSPLLYPNPAAGTVYIAQGTDPVQSVRIFNAAGLVVKTIVNTNANNIITINTGTFGNGFYYVEIRTAKDVYREKMVVKN